MSTLRIMLLVVISLLSSISFGQSTTSEISKESQLIGSWLVNVEGESRTRTLKISGVKESSGSLHGLEASYGWTEGQLVGVKAAISQGPRGRTLSLTTPANGQIEAIQKVVGTFSGILTTKGGVTKNITIARVTEKGLQDAQTTAIAGIIKKPSADVPVTCAAFSGSWKGTWSDAENTVQIWLWVAEINANCVAKIAYIPYSRPPTRFVTAEIKDGTMSFVCNTKTNGTCAFRRENDAISANYSDPAGDTASTTFNRIE